MFLSDESFVPALCDPRLPIARDDRPGQQRADEQGWRDPEQQQPHDQHTNPSPDGDGICSVTAEGGLHSVFNNETGDCAARTGERANVHGFTSQAHSNRR
jgi:hypothetical protein